MAITIQSRISLELAAGADLGAAEQLLAKVIARGLLSEPEPKTPYLGNLYRLGRPQPSAAVPDAPPASADGPILNGALENGIPAGADPVTSENDR